MGFSGPQLVVVSGLFGRNPLMDGILAIRKPFSRTFSFLTMEFRLSGSLSHELFLFSRWNFGYQGAFLTNFFFFHDGISAIREPFSQTFSFFTMEFRLSRSLSHKLFLFSRWNFGYQGAFLTNFSFFTMDFRLSGSLSHELFLFSRWNFGYQGAFLTNFFFFSR
jgi:hypothetical protein